MANIHNPYSQYTNAALNKTSTTTDSGNLSMNGQSYAAQVTIKKFYLKMYFEKFRFSMLTQI